MHHIEWYQHYDPKKLSDVFYSDGYGFNKVCRVSKDNLSVLITCEGSMDFTYNSIRIRSLWDLPKAGIYNDNDYHKAMESESIILNENPWFTTYLIKVGLYDPLDTIDGDLNDAIDTALRVIEDIKTTV